VGRPHEFVRGLFVDRGGAGLEARTCRPRSVMM
jgi:hypothetical protein